MSQRTIFFLGLFFSGLLFASSLAAQEAPKTQQVPYRFKPVKIVAGGYIPGLQFHPLERGLAYARTDMGGAYRFDAKTREWVPLNDFVGMDDYNNMGIESVAIDPRDPSKLYIAVGMYVRPWSENGAILRSSDQGRSFQTTPLPIKLGGNEPGRLSGERLVVDPQNSSVLYFGSRLDGLWESTDGAVSWHAVASFPKPDPTGVGVLTVLADRSAGTILRTGESTPRSKSLYAAVSGKLGGFLHSDNGGATWNRLEGQPKGLMPTNTVLTADGKIFATYCDHYGPNEVKDGAVWRYEIASKKWHEITPVRADHFGYGGIVVDLKNSNHIIVSTLDRWWPADAVYRSTDGGNHWIDIADAHEPRNTIASPWQRVAEAELPNMGAWPTALAIDPFDANHVLLGNGGGIWETNDANGLDNGRFVHWHIGGNGIEETADLVLLSPPIGPHLFSGLGDIGGFRHDDLDLSPAAGAMKYPAFSNTSSIAAAALKPELMVRVGKTWKGDIYGASSSDQGATWKPFANQPHKSQGGGSVALSADGRVILWASDEAPLSWSDDGAKSWHAAELPAGVRDNYVAADPVDAARFYLLDAEHGSLYVSTDAGKSFASYLLTNDQRASAKGARLYVAPGKSGDLWLGSVAGLFHSSGVGSAFKRIDSVAQTNALGFGKSKTEGGYFALYLAGKVDGRAELYRSDDEGNTWQRINDDAHRYGWIEAVSGDPRIYGRVYFGTNGRGVLYGDPAAQTQ